MGRPQAEVNKDLKLIGTMLRQVKAKLKGLDEDTRTELWLVMLRHAVIHEGLQGVPQESSYQEQGKSLMQVTCPGRFEKWLTEQRGPASDLQ